MIPKTVGFINNGYSERDLTNDVKVSDQGIVGCHKNMKLQKVGVVGLVLKVPLVFAKYVTPVCPIRENTVSLFAFKLISSGQKGTATPFSLTILSVCHDRYSK